MELSAPSVSSVSCKCYKLYQNVLRLFYNGLLTRKPLTALIQTSAKVGQVYVSNLHDYLCELMPDTCHAGAEASDERFIKARDDG